MYKILLSLLTLAFTQLSAVPAQKADLGIELLLFKPSIDQSAFVISSSLNVVSGEFFPDGARYNNSFCYQPGFRITGLAAIPGLCNNVEARFSYLDVSHSRSITGPYLFDVIAYPGEGAQAPEDTSYNGTASIRDSFVYYGFDTTLNRYTLCSARDNLQFLIGLHGAYIQHKTRMTSVGTTGPVGTAPVDNLLKVYSQFWGIGPQIGIDYVYNIPCYTCFGLVSSVRGALLCSNTQANTHYTTLRTVGTEGVNLKNDTLWRVTPALDARIGGSYERCVCGFDTALEVGYEWIWYHNSVDAIRGIETAFPGDSIDLLSDLSLQGPYVRLSVGF